MKNLMRIVLKRAFRWLGSNLAEMVREVGNWSVESLFEMDQSWN